MSQSTARPEEQGSGLHRNAWNLFLLIPFLMLVTPWYNSIEPQLFGMPFFYWSQFAWVPVGVICVAIVYVKTKDEPVPAAPGAPGDVDDLDEGTAAKEAGR